MRILHVTDVFRPDLGGIEVFVEDLAERQAAAGHDVSVLTATAEDRLTGALRPSSSVQVVRTTPSLVHPIVPTAARETVLTGGYDVVHAHVSVVSLFATGVARVADEAGVATVCTVHSMWGSQHRWVRAVGAIAGWSRSGLVWTAVSQAAAVEMGTVLPASVPVRVVPNAVDVDWWRAGATTCRRTGKVVTFVSVMRIAGRKRPFALLEILEEVRAAVPADIDVRAVIVGDGPLLRKMRSEVVARRFDGWIAMPGRLTREQIRALYAEADVYVAPAIEESFGIAALEARAAGLPVVAMRAGGVGEFVAHGVEGLLCTDDADMTAALGRLAESPLRRAMAAHNAAERPRHDWPRALAGFDQVYATAHSHARSRVSTSEQVSLERD